MFALKSVFFQLGKLEINMYHSQGHGFINTDNIFQALNGKHLKQINLLCHLYTQGPAMTIKSQRTRSPVSQKLFFYKKRVVYIVSSIMYSCLREYEQNKGYWRYFKRALRCSMFSKSTEQNLCLGFKQNAVACIN